MALHFVLRVNDTAIGAFTAVRTSGGTDADDVNTYRVELLDGDASRRVTEVQHRYGDGAIDLVIAGLQAIQELP